MPPPFTDYAGILRQHARNQGGKTAVLCAGQSLTYAGLADQVARFAGLLHALGLRPGDSFAIALPDGPEFFFAFLGGLHYGAVPIPLGMQLTPKNYAAIFHDAQVAALITQSGSAAAQAWAGADRPLVGVNEPGFPARLAETSPWPAAPPPANGVHFLLYSSGTTGEPKGVPHSQGDMLACARRYAGLVLGLGPRDVVLSASKLHFAFGLGNSLIFPLYYGATALLNPGGSGPAEVFALLDLIAEQRPTVFCAVPSVYALLLRSLESAAGLASLRLCVSAGEALPASLYQAWRQVTGLEILDGIGSTEALHIYISNRPGAAAPGVTGRPVPGYEVRLVGEDGELREDGEPGRLHLRGESLAAGYWNRPDLTAASMREGGWFDTGDMFIRQDGAFRYQGRQDDLFKVGGNWVAPLAVEEVLREHPAVLECAVTAGRFAGLAAPVAHVVPAAGQGGETGLVLELRAFLQTRLPPHMCPVRYVFRRDLPRTQTGKINRAQLDHQA
ncbi:MAG: benzoate-CoA ligase family protein [Deltaproteobacteria bacterium]|nr:benzoate-CoA ligase family protein [Deltaproteobacteria bacterium]